ncbi:MAG: hypothetical protein ABH859_01050 [Pseudomonadota bacterium]
MIRCSGMFPWFCSQINLNNEGDVDFEGNLGGDVDYYVATSPPEVDLDAIQDDWILHSIFLLGYFLTTEQQQITVNYLIRSLLFFLKDNKLVQLPPGFNFESAHMYQGSILRPPVYRAYFSPAGGPGYFHYSALTSPHIEVIFSNHLAILETGQLSPALRDMIRVLVNDARYGSHFREVLMSNMGNGYGQELKLLMQALEHSSDDVVRFSPEFSQRLVYILRLTVRNGDYVHGTIGATGPMHLLNRLLRCARVVEQRSLEQAAFRAIEQEPAAARTLPSIRALMPAGGRILIMGLTGIATGLIGSILMELGMQELRQRQIYEAEYRYRA